MSNGIYAAKTAIMQDVGPIAKSRQNQAQGYSFRGVDEVYEALQLIIARHGVSVTPRVSKYETSQFTTAKGSTQFRVLVLLDVELAHTDGSTTTATALGEALDTGDKSANKAQSQAMKQALINMFVIPTREPKDIEEHNPTVEQQTIAPAKDAALTDDQIAALIDEATTADAVMAIAKKHLNGRASTDSMRKYAIDAYKAFAPGVKSS